MDTSPEYFVLYCDYPRGASEGYLDVDDSVDLEGVTTWSTGARFNLPKDTHFTVGAVVEGDDDDVAPKELYDEIMCLMSARLVAALQASGVDNLDAYPATIQTDRGKSYDYRAVNIIGLVAAADLSASNISNYDGPATIDSSIEGFKADTRRTQHLLMFRLLENVGTIVVHRRVRDSLLAQGINTLSFIEPEDWIQI